MAEKFSIECVFDSVFRIVVAQYVVFNYWFLNLEYLIKFLICTMIQKDQNTEDIWMQFCSIDHSVHLDARNICLKWNRFYVDIPWRTTRRDGEVLRQVQKFVSVLMRLKLLLPFCALKLSNTQLVKLSEQTHNSHLLCNALLKIIYALNYPSARVVIHPASWNDLLNQQWCDLQQDLFLV